MKAEKEDSNRGCIFFLLILILILNFILSIWEPSYYLQASICLIGPAIILFFLSGVKKLRIYSNVINVIYVIYLVLLCISYFYDKGLRYTRSPLWDGTYFVVRPEKVSSYDYKPLYYSQACYFDSSAIVYATQNRNRCIGIVILGQNVPSKKTYILEPLYSAPSSFNSALSIFVENRIVFCKLKGVGNDYGFDEHTTFADYEKLFSVKNNSFFGKYIWKILGVIFGVAFLFMIFNKSKISKKQFKA
jgi:hypothetical protein